MKEGIHPNYQQTTIKCACGNVIETGSTKKDIRVEVCSKCHPFFTGKQKLVDTGGRVAKFNKRFGLKNPIFEATASYGHFGNRPYTERVKVWENGRETEREIEFFGWEKLDAVELIRKEFGL